MSTLPLSLWLLVACCSVTIALGYPFIALLERFGVGKKIRIDGPSSHDQKMGTPTMGGLLICACALIATAVVTLTVHQSAGRSVWVPLFVLVSCAIVGGIDDGFSLVGHSGDGLSVRLKLGVFEVQARVLKSFVIVLWCWPRHTNNPSSQR